MKETKNEWKKYIGIGIALFLTICACILFYYTLFKMNRIQSFITGFMSILQPIIYGMVIAYLLYPIMNAAEKRITPMFEKTKLSKDKKNRYARGISITFALIFGILIVVTVIGLIVPQLMVSIMAIIRQGPQKIADVQKFAYSIADQYPAASKILDQLIVTISDKLNTFVQTDLLSVVSTYIGYVTSGVISFVNVIMNVVIGIIVAIYILSSKELFAGQLKKMLFAIFNTEKANIIINTTRKSNEIFGGFISGKVLDSMIIGVLCFLSLIVLKMPYALLVSVIVGVTNVIPFFGPYIGAIPTTFIILIAEPIKAVYFVIFILVLQQIDGNIIGPKILGDSTGLSPFWVIVAILLGGGLFGVAGMIIGVPTFAVLYYIVKTYIEHILRKKHFPTSSKSYENLDQIDKETKQFKYFES